MQADWYGDSWLRKPSKKTLLELYGSNNAFSMLLPCLSEPYCAKTSMSGQAAYFEVWSPTLSNKWCGKKSSGKAPSPGLLLWGFLWEAARLSHPLLHTMWCSVIIICGTVSSFQEVFQCWSSMSWVFFFSLCSILYDPKDIILCPLFSSMWRWWYFLSQRLLWKCGVSVNLLPDGGFYGRTKHLPIIDFSVGEVDATLEIFFPLSNLLEGLFLHLLLLSMLHMAVFKVLVKKPPSLSCGCTTSRLPTGWVANCRTTRTA